jgi:hypothetical protein
MKLRRGSRSFSFSALVALLLAVCLGGPACGPSGCMTPAPCGEAACRAPEVPACIKLCVTPVPRGKPCSLDPCDQNGTCDIGLTCRLGENGTSTCEILAGGGGPAATCNGDNLPGSESCETGLYCRSSRRCPGVTRTECSFEGVEGAACDSTWIAPFCLPCGPGLDCVAPTGGTCTNIESSPCTCRATCSSSADCPCDGSRCPTSPPQGVGGVQEPVGYCYMCDALGDLGCSDQVPCCDGSECYVSSAGTHESRCCLAGGKQCSSTSDCCPQRLADGAPVDVICGPSRPGAENTCQGCHDIGAFCLTSAECWHPFPETRWRDFPLGSVAPGQPRSRVSLRNGLFSRSR